MIRMAWIQSRTQTAVATAALLVVAVGLAVTGPHLVHLYHTMVATCAARGDCSTSVTAFLRNDGTLRTWLGIALVVIPGIIGIFWGAPLVARELEAGTFRLAWTQSVTRTRWLAIKLAIIGLASAAAAGLFSLILTWWASPLDRANMDSFATFDQRNVVPIGYAVFAFAVGVTAGILIRRTLPAMATTLVAFVAARLVVANVIRPHLLAPAHLATGLDPTTMGYGGINNGPFNLQASPPNIPNSWIYSTRILDKAGHALTPQFLATACPQLPTGAPANAPSGVGGSSGGPLGGGHGTRQAVAAPASVQNALRDCVVKIGATYQQVVTYQPSSRYWTLQWYELGIFLAGAAVLAGVGIWWVRRRLT